MKRVKIPIFCGPAIGHVLTVGAFALLTATVLVSCSGNRGRSLADGASGDMEAYGSGDVNAIVQALPQIMVIPGDQTLQNFQCVKTERADGREVVQRDYQRYLLRDDHGRSIIAVIQDAFNAQGYPLNDFEQTMKQLTTQEATDMADELAKDAKTLLLSTAQPDIILELNYQSSHGRTNLTTHDYSIPTRRDVIVGYTLSAIDAYTNKVVATISANDIKGDVQGIHQCRHHCLRRGIQISVRPEERREQPAHQSAGR